MKNTAGIRISPNSLNLYFECPFCFWLEKKQGIKRPENFAFSLNVEMDKLLRKEFDDFRKKNIPHPLLIENKIKGKLFSDQKLLNEWRDNSRGLCYHDDNLNAALLGAVDDILELDNGTLAPLDYKSTGKSVSNVYDRFQLQMDVYTFLLEKNGFKTPKKAYLAFYTIDKKASFERGVLFRKELHIIDTDFSYVQKLFEEAVLFLEGGAPLVHTFDCRFGKWLKEASDF